MTDGPSGVEATGRPASVVFFGSGAFAVPILERLVVDPSVRIVGVVTAPDRPAGRGGAVRPTPVAARARALGLPMLGLASLRSPEATARIAALRPDVGVLADFGLIVPAAILDVPPRGMLNVHPSLLPRHRGATPIRATIATGDREAGVTIFRMDAGVDTGPVLAADSWPLAGDERAPDLEAVAAQHGAELLARTLGPWLVGSLVPTAQDERRATSTRLVRREDGQLDPAVPAVVLERLVRANDPWPGSFVETALGRIVVHGAAVAPSAPDDVAGTFVLEGDRPALATADGRLVLDELQLAGRQRLAGAEFLRGRPGLIGLGVVRSRER